MVLVPASNYNGRWDGKQDLVWEKTRHGGHGVAGFICEGNERLFDRGLMEVHDVAGKYDGIQWGELVRFQTEGLPGKDGLEDLRPEERVLDLAAFLSKDAGYFAARAQAYFHQMRGQPWGGSAPPEQLLQEMRRSLAFFLGHMIMAAKYLEADVLQEFVTWSEELGVTLQPIAYEALPGAPPR